MSDQNEKEFSYNHVRKITEVLSFLGPDVVIQLIESLQIPEVNVLLLNDRGLQLRLTNSYMEAKRKFEEALKLADKLGFPEGVLESSIGLFDLIRTADRDLEYHNSLIEEAFTIDGLESTKNLKSEYLRVDEVASIRQEMAERYIEELQKNFDLVDGPSDTKVEFYNQRGLFSSDQEKLDEALEYYKSAAEMCEFLIEKNSEGPEALIRFNKRLSRVLNVKGVVYAKQVKIREATEAQEQALTLAKEVSEKEKVQRLINDPETLRAMANPLFSLADLQSLLAEANYQIFENLGDEVAVDGILSSQAGEILKKRDDHQEGAKDFLQQIEEIITRKTTKGKTIIIDRALYMLLQQKKTGTA